MNLKSFFDKPRKVLRSDFDNTIKSGTVLASMFNELNKEKEFDKKIIDKRKLWMKQVFKKHRINAKNTDYAKLPWDINGSLTEVSAKKKR